MNQIRRLWEAAWKLPKLSLRVSKKDWWAGVTVYFGGAANEPVREVGVRGGSESINGQVRDIESKDMVKSETCTKKDCG